MVPGQKESLFCGQSPSSESGIVKRTNVSILGEIYTIRGEEDISYIAEVATLVDERMQRLYYSPSRPRTKAKLAILAAIHLADELLQYKKMRHPMEQAIEARTKQLIELLDEGLSGDPDVSR